MSGLPYSNMRSMIQNSVLGNVMNSATPQNSSTTPNPTGSGIGASLLSGGLGILGGLVGTGFNFLSQSLQRDWNEKMWNAQNEYNDPRAQLSRLMNAGINPAAAVESVLGGNGSQSAPVPTSVGSNVMSSDLGQLMANSVNTSMERDVMQSEVDKNVAETDFIDSQNVGKQLENDTYMAKFNAELRKLNAEGDISDANAEIISQTMQYKIADAATEYSRNLQELNNSKATFDKIESDIMKDYASVYLSMQQANLAEAQIHEVFSKVGLNNAMVERIKHEIVNIDADTQLTYKAATSQEYDNLLKDIQLGYARQSYEVFENSGIDPHDSVWSNAIRLCSTGKQEDVDRAAKLLENTWVVLSNTDSNAKYAESQNRQGVVNSTCNMIKSMAMLMGATALSSNPNIGARYVSPKDARGMSKGHVRQNLDLGKAVNNPLWSTSF